MRTEEQKDLLNILIPTRRELILWLTARAPDPFTVLNAATELKMPTGTVSSGLAPLLKNSYLLRVPAKTGTRNMIGYEYQFPTTWNPDEALRFLCTLSNRNVKTGPRPRHRRIAAVDLQQSLVTLLRTQNSPQTAQTLATTLNTSKEVVTKRLNQLRQQHRVEVFGLSEAGDRLWALCNKRPAAPTPPAPVMRQAVLDDVPAPVPAPRPLQTLVIAPEEPGLSFAGDTVIISIPHRRDPITLTKREFGVLRKLLRQLDE